jgi:hypothetical protein
MSIHINYYYNSKILFSSFLDDKDIPIVGSGITMKGNNYKVVLVEEIAIQGHLARNIHLEKL